MGSGESTTRRVSFGVDDEDRVRILRGVKLSEDVLQRMKGVANIPPQRSPSPTPQKDPGSSPIPSPSPQPQPSPKPQSQPSPKPQSQPSPQPQRQPSPKPQPQPSPKPQSQPSPQPQRQPSPKPQPQHQPSPKAQSQPSPKPQSQPSTRTNTSKTASPAKDKLWRSEREQVILREELAKVAQREREAARADMNKALNRERLHTHQEKEKARLMALQLQQRDVELKALDIFYKEQLLQMENRNMERFKQSNEQFHSAASKTEANVRPRSTEPVCPGLQTQILSCYRENREQTLRCSELAKEYMQCINAAKKSLLVNHG